GPTLDNEAPSANNDSIVLRIKFGERSFLFTGDLESAGEAAVIRGEEHLHADVVKVGHHGSKTSSTAMFVNAVHPAFAIISVGQRSMFGHPNKEVVERWRMTGATVLTTGNCGTITVSTNGNDLRLETLVPCQDKL
ncbi:MAG TPA: hypothetical protein VIV66_00945, partial [Pyrinomonadaceae bacterium]